MGFLSRSCGRSLGETMWANLEEDLAELFSERGLTSAEKLYVWGSVHDPSPGSLWLRGDTDVALKWAERIHKNNIAQRAESEDRPEAGILYGSPDYYRARRKRLYSTPEWRAKKCAAQKAWYQANKNSEEFKARHRIAKMKWWNKLPPERKAEIKAKQAIRDKLRGRRKGKKK